MLVQGMSTSSKRYEREQYHIIVGGNAAMAMCLAWIWIWIWFECSGRRSDSQTDKSKRTEFVCPWPALPLSTGSDRCLTARLIREKEQNSFWPSSTRPLSAGSDRRSTARQIQSKRTEFVCSSPTRPLSAGWDYRKRSVSMEMEDGGWRWR